MVEAAHGARAGVRREPARAWVHIFVVGLVLWIATVAVTFLTSNSNLLPTIVLLGSFLVPVTFVAWAYERGRGAEVTVPLLFNAFIVGGVLGVLGASLAETYALRPSPWMYVGVGLIEEGAKLLALLFVARHLHPRTGRAGLVLGATVGFGFAAFESAGYAFNALFSVRGLSLTSMVETEILRGILAPVGHGLWTAILGGVVFAAAARGGPGGRPVGREQQVGKSRSGRAGREERWRLTAGVVFTYLGVALLHALWDSMHGFAIAFMFLLTGSPFQYDLLEHGYLPPTSEDQAHLVTVLDWAGLIVVSAAGLVWVWTLIDRYVPRRRQAAPPAPPVPPTGTPPAASR